MRVSGAEGRAACSATELTNRVSEIFNSTSSQRQETSVSSGAAAMVASGRTATEGPAAPGPLTVATVSSEPATARSLLGNDLAIVSRIFGQWSQLAVGFCRCFVPCG